MASSKQTMVTCKCGEGMTCTCEDKCDCQSCPCGPTCKDAGKCNCANGGKCNCTECACEGCPCGEACKRKCYCANGGKCICTECACEGCPCGEACKRKEKKQKADCCMQ